MDFGNWVIVAGLLGTDGQMHPHSAQTLFDRDACVREAKMINQEWRAAGVPGIVTCKQIETE